MVLNYLRGVRILLAWPRRVVELQEWNLELHRIIRQQNLHIEEMAREIERLRGRG